MGAVHYRDGISILQLIVFVPCFFIGLVLCFRHGWGKGLGWYFITLLSLMRILGASFLLATINQPNTEWLYIAAAVLTGIGISPLVLLSMGLIARVNESLRRVGKNLISPQVFRLTSLLSLVGLILVIVGNSTGNHGAVTGEGHIAATSKAGDVLFLVTLIFVFGFWFACAVRKPYIPQGEKRILAVTAIILPLTLVRVLYSIYYVFSGNIQYNPFFGNTTYFLVLAVLEEIVVVILAVAVGLTLSVVPKEDRHQHNPADAEARAGSGPYPYASDPKFDSGATGQHIESQDPSSYNRASRRPRRRGRGPTSMLFFYIKDTMAERKAQQNQGQL